MPKSYKFHKPIHQIRADMGRYGQIWADMCRYAQIRADMLRCGQIWSDTCRYAQIWTEVVRYAPAELWTTEIQWIWIWVDGCLWERTDLSKHDFNSAEAVVILDTSYRIYRVRCSMRLGQTLTSNRCRFDQYARLHLLVIWISSSVRNYSNWK